MPVSGPVPSTPAAIRGVPSLRAAEEAAPLTPGAMLLKSASAAKDQEEGAPLTPGAALLRSALAAKEELESCPASLATDTHETVVGRDAGLPARAEVGISDGIAPPRVDDSSVAPGGSDVAASCGDSSQKRAAEPVLRFAPKRRKSVANTAGISAKTEAAPLSPPGTGAGGVAEVQLGMSFGDWQRVRDAQAGKSVLA